jgi:hypothetical protein
MSDKQPSKRRKTEKSEKSEKSGKSSSRRMEDDLNRSSFRSGGAARRPPHDKDPCTAAADPYVPPMGYESHRAVISARPQTSNETGHGATSVQPLVGNETGQVAPTWIPHQEGNAAPVTHAPAGPSFDGSHADMRGAVRTGYEHGANYGGYLATKLNSSRVNDDEAASRAEYRYQQQVQGHASRTPAYGDPYGCPRPNARSNQLRTSFDGREGESQSLHALGRIEGIMARMEHLAASTPAPATSSVTHSVPFNSGEFRSFIFTLNCWNLPMFFGILRLAFFWPNFVACSR